MTRLFDQTKHLADIATPNVQDLVDRVSRLEGDDPGWTIDARIYRFFSHQFTERPFRSEGW